MTKVRWLVLLAVVALVLFPAMALAQPDLPCRFHGEVTVDGVGVEDATIITATIEGDEYTATTPSVYGDSTYLLEIAPPVGTTYTEGAAITFKIGDQAVAQTGAWERGGNFELDLFIGVGPGPVDGGTISRVEVNTLAAGATATVDWNAATGVLTLGIPQGDEGPQGVGTQGPQGDAGEDGTDAPGGIALPIVALVIAIIAVIVALSAMRRKV